MCGWIFPHNLDLELRSGPTTSEINLTTHPNTPQKVSEPNVPLPETGVTGTLGVWPQALLLTQLPTPLPGQDIKNPFEF